MFPASSMLLPAVCISCPKTVHFFPAFVNSSSVFFNAVFCSVSAAFDSFSLTVFFRYRVFLFLYSICSLCVCFFASSSCAFSFWLFLAVFSSRLNAIFVSFCKFRYLLLCFLSSFSINSVSFCFWLLLVSCSLIASVCSLILL